jgi:hypothetical protein
MQHAQTATSSHAGVSGAMAFRLQPLVNPMFEEVLKNCCVRFMMLLCPVPAFSLCLGLIQLKGRLAIPKSSPTPELGCIRCGSAENDLPRMVIAVNYANYHFYVKINDQKFLAGAG